MSGGEAGRRLDSVGFDRSVSSSFGAIVLWPRHFGTVLARWVGGFLDIFRVILCIFDVHERVIVRNTDLLLLLLASNKYFSTIVSF